MTAAQYVRMLGGKRQSDADYDIDEKDITCKKLQCLQKFGFRFYFFSDGKESGVHIHAPMRKKKSWFDRGWQWQLGIAES